MRLISQDGTYDFPYKHVVVYRNGTSVVCGIMPDIREKVLLGKYSSKAKALKAMEMLREYKETKEIRSIPLTTSLMESFANAKMENFEICTDGIGDYLKVDIVKKAEYFKFPADEEVEV